MRVNIYADELTDDIEIVRKSAADGDFVGLRIHTDARRGAATLWFRSRADLDDWVRLLARAALPPAAAAAAAERRDG